MATYVFEIVEHDGGAPVEEALQRLRLAAVNLEEVHRVPDGVDLQDLNQGFIF